MNADEHTDLPADLLDRLRQAIGVTSKSVDPEEHARLVAAIVAATREETP